jgi:hypothetical protein
MPLSPQRLWSSSAPAYHMRQMAGLGVVVSLPSNPHERQPQFRAMRIPVEIRSAVAATKTRPLIFADER